MPKVEIQRKREVPWWAWLLGVLVVAAIIWWIVAARTEDRDADIATAPQDGDRMFLVKADPLTGTNPARWFYRWVEVGTPILVRDGWPEGAPAASG